MILIIFESLQKIEPVECGQKQLWQGEDASFDGHVAVTPANSVFRVRLGHQKFC
jgi:hypothetical protein